MEKVPKPKKVISLERLKTIKELKELRLENEELFNRIDKFFIFAPNNLIEIINFVESIKKEFSYSLPQPEVLLENAATIKNSLAGLHKLGPKPK